MSGDTRQTVAGSRVVMPEHALGYGLKSKHLLETHDCKVEDHDLWAR
ncbi:hypothetical protein [Oceanicola sp. 22II-s10i]